MIARTEAGLQACLDQVLALQQRAQNLHIEGSRIYNPGWHTARDIQNNRPTSWCRWDRNGRLRGRGGIYGSRSGFIRSRNQFCIWIVIRCSVRIRLLRRRFVWWQGPVTP